VTYIQHTAHPQYLSVQGRHHADKASYAQPRT
jgi:hypothetical protein